MKLSIIIPVYNVEQYVEKCIRSCANQGVPFNDFEIICVNDGSTDNSLCVLEKLAKEYPNIKIVSQNNRGLSAARNIGMSTAIGEYYMFVDSDDWIAKGSLVRIIEKLNLEKPDILCICSTRTDGEKEFAPESFESEKPLTGPQALANGLNPCAPFSIVRSSFVKDNSFYFCEGIFHEDSELTPRMHYSASKISFLNGITYYYYVNMNSIMGKPNPKKSYDLINVVCPSLSCFANKIPYCDRYIFDNMISMYLNNACSFICNCDVQSQNEFNNLIKNKKKLLLHLKKSTIMKYKIEGVLFDLFPGNILYVYKVIAKIHNIVNMHKNGI